MRTSIYVIIYVIGLAIYYLTAQYLTIVFWETEMTSIKTCKILTDDVMFLLLLLLLLLLLPHLGNQLEAQICQCSSEAPLILEPARYFCYFKKTPTIKKRAQVHNCNTALYLIPQKARRMSTKVLPHL